MKEHYDVIVVGLGHAGCEAASAAAKKGVSTLAFTINLDAIALMPCNPSIGGVGKSHIVCEVDALGGVMGAMSDKCCTAMKVLNTSRGPAVQALRQIIDKKKYQASMKAYLESLDNLELFEDEVTGLSKIDDHNDKGLIITTKSGVTVTAEAVILTTGTYLKADIVIGRKRFPSGPHGQLSALFLSESLRKLGLTIDRLQTATPPRVNRSSADLDKLELVESDIPLSGLSYTYSDYNVEIKDDSWIIYTGTETVDAVSKNINESPLTIGNITNKGPRHCPSIDRKVMRFPEKSKHRLFIEPEGEKSTELYIAGLSTGIATSGQRDILASVNGFEDSWITRYAYAIEYDYIDPSHLGRSLESRVVSGLFTAGQVNGTSGYEEAACQGLIAGLNAANKVLSKEPLILQRWQAYTGVLIDDLILKPLSEPYRMMPSFVEYRLNLRCDNADLRLTPIGRQQGIVDDQRWEKFQNYKAIFNREKKRLSEYIIKPNKEVRAKLDKFGGTIGKAVTAAELLKRKEVNYPDLAEFGFIPRDDVTSLIALNIGIDVKYEGYLLRQESEIRRQKKLEDLKIPNGFDFDACELISFRARKSLGEKRPITLGQASRMEGVSPADVGILANLWLCSDKKPESNQ